MEFTYRNVTVKVSATFGGYQYRFMYRRVEYTDYSPMQPYQAISSAKQKIDELKAKASRKRKPA